MEVPEILERTDILDVISRYVDLEQRGSEWWGISPFSNPPENTPSFSVRPDTGKWYDFSSGNGGTAITFLEKFHNISKHQAINMLKEIIGVEKSGQYCEKYHEKLPICHILQQYKTKIKDKRAISFTVLPDNYMDRYEKRSDKLEIWRKEGITDEAMQFFDVRYDGFSNCLVYPIRNQDGQIVNIGGRTLDPQYKEKKLRKYTYFKPWGGAMAVIYGLYENRESIQSCHEVILFEGMKSVMLARGFGFKNCGAILTSHLNPSQMKMLARLGVRVVFALDKEVDIRADRNIAMLRRFVNVEYIYDFRGVLGAKDAPVDKGADIFRTLYINRYKYT